MMDGSEGSHDRCGEDKHGHRHGHVLTRVQHIRKHFHRPNIPAETDRQRERERERQRQRERETDRQRERQTKRETERGRREGRLLRGEREEEERTDMNNPEAKPVTTPPDM
jgi:hypothetical protein